MNRQCTLCVAALVVGAGAGRAAVIGGNIDGVDFAPAGGQYVVESNAVVPERTTVTLPAGTVLQFGLLTQLIVEGTLVVEGLASAPVVFTCLRDTGAGGAAGDSRCQWKGIRVTRTCTRAVFRHAHITRALYGMVVDADSVTIDSTTFVDNRNANLKVNGTVARVTDGVPYSYSPPRAGWPARATPRTGVPRTRRERALRALRYSFLGLGLAAATVGTVCTVRAVDYADQRDNASNAPEWDGFEQQRLDYANTAVGTFVGAGVMLVGFGVTFWF